MIIIMHHRLHLVPVQHHGGQLLKRHLPCRRHARRLLVPAARAAATGHIAGYCCRCRWLTHPIHACSGPHHRFDHPIRRRLSGDADSKRRLRVAS